MQLVTDSHGRDPGCLHVESLAQRSEEAKQHRHPRCSRCPLDGVHVALAPVIASGTAVHLGCSLCPNGEVWPSSHGSLLAERQGSTVHGGTFVGGAGESRRIG